MLLAALLLSGCGASSPPLPASTPGGEGEAGLLVERAREPVAACAAAPTVESCAPAAALFEALAPAHLGHGRTSDMVLFALARLGDDHAQLVRASGSETARVAAAQDHLVGAVAAVEHALAAGLAEAPDLYGARVPDAAADAAAEAHLHDQFQRYALEQGTDPERVRWRQLEARLSGMEAEVAARPPSPEATALGGLLAVYRRVLTRYRAGEVTTEAVHDAVVAELEAARRVWSPPAGGPPTPEAPAAP